MAQAQATQHRGIFYMFGSATIWGTWILIISSVSLPSIYILPITFTSTAIALSVYIILRGHQSSLIRIFQNQKFLRLILWVGFLEVLQSSLYIISYSIAIQDGGSVVIPIIRSLAGIITPLLATMSTNERFSKTYLIYGTLSSFGAILIFSRGGITAGEDLSYLALGMVTTSVIIRGWFYLQQRFVAQEMTKNLYDTTHVLTAQMIISASILIVISVIYFLVTPAPTIENLPQEFVFLAVFGLTHTGLASMLRLLAMRQITAQQSIIIMYFEPFLSVMLSILFLGETVTIGFFIGAGLILFSAGATSLQSSKIKKG